CVLPARREEKSNISCKSCVPASSVPGEGKREKSLKTVGQNPHSWYELKRHSKPFNRLTINSQSHFCLENRGLRRIPLLALILSFPLLLNTDRASLPHRDLYFRRKHGLSC